jgi:ABC-2 type transport system permease protein
MKRKLFTVWIFAKLNTRRFFRDKTAIFFTVAFPLIFLFVFGGIFGRNSDTSFNVAIVNQSHTKIATQFTEQTRKSKILKVDEEVTGTDKANEKMSRGQLDATIVLPASFGEQEHGQEHPSGQARIIYTQNNQQAAQALAGILQNDFRSLNGRFVSLEVPFTVTAEQTNTHSLSSFDYIFSGLLGFSILGLGIFGPINVFPELKKQGILRRLHTTPLRVWQYFLSTMMSQAIIGLIGMAVQFAVAMSVFHLKLVGNIVELSVFLVFGIVMILGIGLAVGGWARNERQAAPLANIIVFPMMFLSGTFFPRFLMPEWLQSVTNFLPLTPIIDGIRLIATEGNGLLDMLPQLGIIAGWMIIVYAIAFRSFRWE